MKLLADENIDLFIVDYLRSRGHDTTWIREFARGSQDVDILQLGQEEQRVIITFDHDFGDLVFRQNLPNAGVVLLRFEARSRIGLLHAFQHAWPSIEPYAANHFVVVSEQKIRVRPLGPLGKAQNN
ncbi:MAG TPA: DUF5615 family PIN-like protein [Phycisphaerae bacterium]|nr:DUF5615 family PIN-like protein [Phycisphaerae bacterium]